MPTLLALLLASSGSFAVGKLCSSLYLAIPVSTLAWLVIYIFIRKFLKDLRP
ncbi:MAG: hypothetical protein PF442_01380 [Desulfobulbaceae bacterium]|nr:hypothetical protein [Desulfobulbaceae bacterium]